MKNIMTLMAILLVQMVMANPIDSIFIKREKPVPLVQVNPLLYDDDCDVCGCSASGGSMGYNSMLTDNFVGLRYIYQTYTSKDEHYANSPWIDERFTTIQLWSRIPVFKNFEVVALVPYRFNRRVNDQKDEQINGLGDVTVLGFYTFFETNADSLAVNHKWQIGAGVKMPTGEYREGNNGSINPSFQLGSGSWDYTLATTYTLRYDQLGFNANLNYIFKTENSMERKYGNQLNFGGTFFYTAKLKKVTLVPFLDMTGEIHASEEEFGYEMPHTSGELFFGKFGVEAGFNRFSVGVNAMLPISQNLNNGMIEANYRLAINLNYLL